MNCIREAIGIAALTIGVRRLLQHVHKLIEVKCSVLCREILSVPSGAELSPKPPPPLPARARREGRTRGDQRKSPADGGARSGSQKKHNEGTKCVVCRQECPN
jgi:hypothetical protein